MATRTVLTFEQFGMRHELIRGEHVVRPPANIVESLIRQNLHDALRPYVRQQNLGAVYIAAGFKLSSDSFLKTDATFVRNAQLGHTKPDSYFEGAPALAIEVVSESNAAAELDLKMELYFAHGAEEVWVVFPQTRRVRAHFPDGHSETFDHLHTALLRGWAASPAAIFAN